MMSGNMTTSTALEISVDVMRQNAINFRPFGMTIAFWSIFVGSIGNFLTILTFVANKKLRTTFNIFLLNLAVIDFLTATLMLPFNLAGYFQMQWPFGNQSFTARIQAYSYFCCGYSSVVFLIAITVNRFIGGIFPAKYKIWFSSERMKWILPFCNLFAPVFLLPFLAGTAEDCRVNNNLDGRLTGFHEVQFLCTIICIKSYQVYSMLIRVLFQFVPLVVIIVLYAATFSVVHKQRSDLTIRMGKGSLSSMTQTVINKKSSNYKRREVQLQKRKREDGRMLVISVVICIGFMITFLPSVIVNILPNRGDIDVRWHMAASNLAWLNSSLNPIIYVFLNRRFRREYWRIILIGVGLVREKFVHDSSTAGTSVAIRNVDTNSRNTNSK